MAASNVYFTNLHTKPGKSLLDKTEALVKAAGIDSIDFNNKFTAIKIHFGEPGNLAYLRPNYAARVVKLLQEKGAKVFLTDSNTLYAGRRSNAVDHLQSAMENGFNPISVGCNVIIADGLKSGDYREIPVNGKYCKTAKIGSAIADADIIISLTHFKGHEQAGFGGTLKNLGMGSASVGGKLELHSSSKPVIQEANCTACKQCVKNCAHGAVSLQKKDGKTVAVISYDKCVGCGQCVAVCLFDAAQVVWNSSSDIMNCKVAEYSQAAIQGKPHFHISFIMDVSPLCDCWGMNDVAIIPDLGIAASFDPVALDKACVDMVTKATANQDSCLHKHMDEHRLEGEDKFKLIHPNTDWRTGLEHAQTIGLGSMDYSLVEVK